MHDYDSISKSYGGYWNYDIMDFCFIRNMYFPPKPMIEEMKDNFHNLIINYGSSQNILDEKLAKFVGCNPSNIILLNGASQIYPILAKSFAEANILIPSPTFSEYTRIFKNIFSYSDNMLIDFDELISVSVSKGCNVVIFVNPNNPTGTQVQTEDIFKFACDNNDKTIIVDESFIDFASTSSILNILEKEPLSNLLVIKSLSKVYGVPGLRIGFFYSRNTDWINQIKPNIPIWNSNSFAEFFFETLKKYSRVLYDSFTLTINDRENFRKKLKCNVAVKNVFPSSANFFATELSDKINSVKTFAEFLLSDFNVFIKDSSEKFDNRKIVRLAVRLPNENEKLFSAFTDTYNKYYL